MNYVNGQVLPYIVPIQMPSVLWHRW